MTVVSASTISIRDDAALRRAVAADVDRLVEVCRRACPDALLWRSGDAIARRWWDAVLRSSACEAWVVARRDGVRGVAVLVHDADAWSSSSSSRDAGNARLLRSVMQRPWVLPMTLVHARRREAREASDVSADTAMTPVDRAIPILAVTPGPDEPAVRERLRLHIDRRRRQLGLPVPAEGDGRGDLPVTTLTTPASLARLAQPWRAARCTRLPAPNSDPRIFAATLEAFGEAAQPHVSVVGDPEAPRALVIGRRSLRAVRCRLGYASVRSARMRCLDIVYGGLITDGSAAATHAVGDHLADLLDGGDVDHVMINHLPTSHELFSTLTHPQTFPFASVCGRARPHWSFDLAPGSFDHTMIRFSRKHRYNIRRQDRLLVEHFGGDVALEHVTRRDQLDAFADSAERITAAGYQAALTGGFDPTGVQRRVLASIADEGGLRSFVLRCGNEPVAYQCGVVLDGVYHLRSTAFLPSLGALSPGQVLLVRVLADLAAEGITRVDYGLGDARYKSVYGNASRDEATIHLYADNLRAAAAHALEVTCGSAMRCASWLATRAGVMDRVKRGWRARLARRPSLRSEAQRPR